MDEISATAKGRTHINTRGILASLWFSTMRCALVALRRIVTGIVGLLLVLLLFALESNVEKRLGF